MKSIKPYKWPVSKKRTAGRPSKYRPDIVRQAKAYLHSCQDKFDIRPLMSEVNLPTIGGFALRLGVSKDTLYALGKKYESYRLALEEIKDAQHIRLINGGLSGRYNARMVLYYLRLNHGYVLCNLNFNIKPVGVLRSLFDDTGRPLGGAR